MLEPKDTFPEVWEAICKREREAETKKGTVHKVDFKPRKPITQKNIKAKVYKINFNRRTKK